MVYRNKFLFLMAWIFFPLILSAHESTCSPKNYGLNTLNPQIIYQVGDAINHLDISNQENCFQELTFKDKAFFNSLSRSLLKSTSDREAKKTMDNAIKNYRAENGTEASKRVLIAIRAEAHKQQILSLLKIFQDPKISESFKKFANSLVNYETSLSKVTFQDIRSSDPESKWDAALVWMRQRSLMALDLVKTKINSKAETRYKDHYQAASQFFVSGIELNAKITELQLSGKISEEQRDILTSQVAILNSSIKERYEGEKDKLASERKVALLASRGLISAALMATSGGLLGEAFLSAAGGNFAASTAVGALSGAVGSTGVTALTQTSAIILEARAKSLANESNLVCELARRVDDRSGQDLNEVWNATWSGALMGGALGGGMGAILKIAPKTASVLGVLMALTGGVKTAIHMEGTLEDKAALNQELENLKTKKISTGEMIDAKVGIEKKKADLNADLVGEMASLGILATGTRKGLQTKDLNALERNTQLKKEERFKEAIKYLGRPLTRSQQAAIMLTGKIKAKPVPPGAQEIEVFRFERQKIIKIYKELRSAGFTKDESKILLESRIAGSLFPEELPKLRRSIP